MHKMARWNGVPEKVPEVVLYNPRKAFKEKANIGRQSIAIGALEFDVEDIKGVAVPVSDLWKDAILRKHLIFSCVLW